jgi:hypothetical protein
MLPAPFVYRIASLVTSSTMLRKALWSGLYAGIGAAATIGARRVASRLWRLMTGEEPPTKK